MMRTSYSTIFNEGLDFSAVLLDPRRPHRPGRRTTPVDDGPGPALRRWAVEENGADALPARRCAGPQRLLPRRLPPPRAHDDAPDVRRRRGSSGSPATSGTSPRSGARRPAPSPPTPPTSTRKGCGCRR